MWLRGWSFPGFFCKWISLDHCVSEDIISYKDKNLVYTAACLHDDDDDDDDDDDADADADADDDDDDDDDDVDDVDYVDVWFFLFILERDFFP